MSYFRDRFSSFEEFQRETSSEWGQELGKEEIELLHEIEEQEHFDRRPRGRRRSSWD